MADHDTWKALHRLTNLTTKLLLNGPFDGINVSEDLTKIPEDEFIEQLKAAEKDYSEKKRKYDFFVNFRILEQSGVNLGDTLNDMMRAQIIYQKYSREMWRRMDEAYKLAPEARGGLPDHVLRLDELRERLARLTLDF